MTTFREITFSINGRPRTLYIDMRKSLLEVLRQDLGLTGAKQGCGGVNAVHALFWWTRF